MQTTTSMQTWQASSSATAPQKDARPAGCEIEEIASPDALYGYAREIENLAACALVPNILAETPFLHAAWTWFFGHDPQAKVILVRDVSAGADRRLIGLMPVSVDWSLWGCVPLGTSFRNDMKFCGLALLDREKPAQALDAMVAEIARRTPFPSTFLFEEMPARGPAAEAMAEAFCRAGWKVRTFGDYERVVLDASRPGDEYLAGAISGKKRKEYRRVANRLKDMGALDFTIVGQGAGFMPALEGLLRLEKQGWKGENGTAILDREEWSGYFRDATERLAGMGQAQIACLSLGGKAIAAGLVVTSGTAAWFYKIAYDETLSQYSPGVLLTLELTKYFCDHPDILSADSCAPGDHPMIAHIWRERETYCDILAVPPGSPSRLIFAAETIRREARKFVKKSYHSIKRKVRG